MDAKIKLGYDIQTQAPIYADLCKTAHACYAGGTDSGKSTSVLFALNGLLSLPVEVDLFIADFKKSGDYKGLSRNFAEFDKTTELIDFYYEEFERTPEKCPKLKILVLDEYAGYIIWLMQNDKKKCEEIKSKISNLLMMGRSKHCCVWTIQQRMTAQLFSAGIGACDNYGTSIGMARMSADGRRALFSGEHFEDKEFEESYHPGQGQGICLIQGQPLRAIQIPRVSDVGKLHALLARKAKAHNCI